MGNLASIDLELMNHVEQISVSVPPGEAALVSSIEQAVPPCRLAESRTTDNHVVLELKHGILAFGCPGNQTTDAE